MLGKLITEESHRDAIHIAIAPVLAAEKLAPGQGVGFVEGSETFVEPSSKPIGIIDPFLKGLVFPDQSCWLCLFPETVTGMRHHWSHPAFASPEPAVQTQPVAPAESLTSKEWIAKFAYGIDQDVESLMFACQRYVERGDYEYDNNESYKYPEFGTWKEFWRHWGAVTGAELPDGDYQNTTPYTCSC